ncbi:activity-regulated cytoskeleton associated protein 2-like [Musca domestica]|uniref:Activity-regulated cytoskeleton associated protein 2-like n=1 Tax=Musca domestica TaxID=7370 RepID=A0ABM3V5N2_MUSDO|nr:activity-regulated cytoskeleton associated protein 2-like [Musca domestica]
MTSASLTTEQFETLVKAVAAANVKVGTFSHCSARYNGEKDSTKLEEFISAITTFKTVENIGDMEAINSMPMLLLGDASEWWSGVKSKAKKFDDVVNMLRDSFCPAKPAWRIYAEICEGKQQKNEATDVFIRKKRALFAKLPKVPSENDQIDILFGMLHVQIRERVIRHKVANFDELLKDAREAEDSLNEPSPHTLECCCSMMMMMMMIMILMMTTMMTLSVIELCGVVGVM